MAWSKVKLCDPSERHSLPFCSKQPKLGPAPNWDGLPYSSPLRFENVRHTSSFSFVSEAKASILCNTRVHIQHGYHVKFAQYILQ